MDISNIIKSISANRIRITDHADEEAANDGLTLEDIYYSVLHGEIIKQYPDDKPYPSCLILGWTSEGHPIHSVWGYNEGTRFAVLITVYRLDPNLWIDWRKRRRKS